jgi:hypothetical protein
MVRESLGESKRPAVAKENFRIAVIQNHYLVLSTFADVNVSQEA